jgi:hypothetical protein
MGIIVTDNYELENGMTITDHYVRIKDIKIFKLGSNVQYHVNISAYTSKDTADTGKPFLYENCTGMVSETIPDENIYSNLYTCVKLLYENYTDDI